MQLWRIQVVQIPVASTSISAIAYDKDTSVLDIEFRNGSKYRYFLVPAHVYSDLRTAPSKGTYFNTAVRGRYAFTKNDDLARSPPKTAVQM
jgi:hypothetical protein